MTNSQPAFIDSLDTKVFTILTALSENDRQSFLRVQQSIRNALGSYRYLEIGSEMGGSLIPHLLDPCCRSAVSIDLRPSSMPDERGTFFHYSDNSTAKMRQTLEAHIGSVPLAKLSTVDSDASAVSPDAIDKVHIAMIDGEHTNVACFSDFVSVMSMLENDAVISFHDSNLVADAILNGERMLEHLRIPFETVFLPDCVAVIGLRGMASIVREELAPHALEREEYLVRSRSSRWHAVADSMLASGYFGKLQNAEQRLDETERSLAEISAALRNAQAEIATYRSSRSWALTAPLRRLIAKVRGNDSRSIM